MLIDLADVKKIRKKLDITQKQLSEMSGVSQSLIAKIESGRMDPSYSNARKIIRTLEHATQKKERLAEDMMQKKIFSVHKNDKIKKAIKLMQKYEISQMPVVEDHKPVGYITEIIILKAVMGGVDHNREVHEIMQESPPIVSKDSNASVISELLRYYQMVLVTEKGKLKGVIARADILDKI